MNDKDFVVKGLECCGQGNKCPADCPYYDIEGCQPVLRKDCLGVIRKQDEKIRVLKIARDKSSYRVRVLKEKNKKLEIKNAELSASVKELHTKNAALASDLVDLAFYPHEAKAEIVKRTLEKAAELIKRRYKFTPHIGYSGLCNTLNDLCENGIEKTIEELEEYNL